MQHHIGVRMACQPQGVRDLNPAKYQLAPALKPMDIKAVSYAKIALH